MFRCIINRDDGDLKNSAFYPVKVMLDEKYSNDKSFENTIIILGYNLGKKIDYYRENFPGKKIIVYQLEQLYNNKSLWYDKKSKNNLIKKRTEQIIDWLTKCDEIWDYDIDNKNFLIKEGFSNVIFYPLHYSQNLKVLDKEECKTDILFFGSINKKRARILSLLKNKYNIKIIGDYSFIDQNDIKKYGLTIQQKKYGHELNKEIKNAKIILNLNYYESKIQEQVRIFPLVINNKCVLSQKTLRNYFGDLIVEFIDDNDLIEKLNFLLKDNNWEKVSNGISEKFKNKNKMDIKIGANYNTFYGVKNLEKSIESIKNIVSYVIVVHQKKGFNNEEEPNYNDFELDRLQKLGYVDEIVYYDVKNNNIHEGILEKRNIGLDKCRKNGCEYIITLDSDENYNERELYSDIKKMKKNNYTTLYNRIKTYYHSEDYYFFDNYFVPSVYKIDERKYEKNIKTSYIVDPVRKQKESNFLVSNHYMHHFSYFTKDWEEKLNKKISLKLNKNLIGNEILDHLKNWKFGQQGKVLLNDSSGNISLQKINIQKNIFDNSEIKKSLSVIIPTYNNTEYLDESLNSVINSGKNHNIEILIGIDGCEKTLNYIKQKTYPDFVKFYYFSSNNGPYIVKNTLSQIVNSDKILFFDSDDITEKESIQKLITLSRDYQVVRPKYVDFNLNRKTLGTNHGEGVFMIDKKLFLDMNGFEPWRVAADTEFMNRVRLKNVKTYLTPEILFKRRIHPQGLTSRKDTGIGSTLRNKYVQLMNNKKGLQNPSEQHIANYEIVTENILIKKLPEVKKTNLGPILNKQPRKVVENKIIKPPKKPISPDLRELLKPKDNVIPRPQNKEKFYADINPIKTQQNLIRQTLIEQKKNTTISHMLKGMGNKKGGGNIGGKFST